MQLGYPVHSGKIGNLLDMENTGGCSPPISPFPHPICWLGHRVPTTPHACVGGELEAGANSVAHEGDDSGREVGLGSDGIPGTRLCLACARTRPRCSAPESGLSYGSANCLWGWLC